MCTFFLVVAFHDARFLSGLYHRFSYIVCEIEEVAIKRHILRLIADQAPVIATEFSVSVAARAKFPLTKAALLEVILCLLLPPGRQRIVEQPPRVLCKLLCPSGRHACCVLSLASTDWKFVSAKPRGQAV